MATPDELDYFPEGTRVRELDLASGLHARVYERGPEDAPAILFLHGFPELAVSWRHQFESLGEHFRVIAPDMRGYGGTDAPGPVREYAMSKLVDDAVHVLDALGLERAHLVGHDWGGAVAWEAAARRPDRFESLSVCNCPPRELLFRRLFTDPRQLRRSWYVFWFQVPGLAERALAKDPEGAVWRSFRGTAGRKEVFDAHTLAPYIRQVQDRGLPGIRYYRAALRGRPRWNPERVRIPTRLIWGMRDGALGPWFAEPEPYSRFVDDFDRVLIPDAGHWVQQEAPGEVSAAIREHVERICAAKPGGG